MNVIIESTKSLDILKFRVDEPLLDDGEFLEISPSDDLADYPFAASLFQLPFVSNLFISSEFIAIKKTDGIDWEEIKSDLAGVISDLLSRGIQIKKKPRRVGKTVYVESTPNPNVNKFVSNVVLSSHQHEFKRGEDCVNSPLVQRLFKNNFLEEVFIRENYISLTKSKAANWDDIQFGIRDMILEYLNSGESIFISLKNSKASNTTVEELDAVSRLIVSTLSEYIEPAVSSDGGNIEFKSYNPDSGEVKVILRGACSGCPSSAFTLKNAIEETLKNIIGDDKIKNVVADMQ